MGNLICLSHYYWSLISKDSYLIHNNDCPSIKQKECVSKSKEPLVSSYLMMHFFVNICSNIETMDISNPPLYWVTCIWIKREKFYIS